MADTAPSNVITIRYVDLLKRAWMIMWWYPALVVISTLAMLPAVIFRFITNSFITPIASANAVTVVRFVELAMVIVCNAFSAGALIALIKASEEGKPAKLGTGLRAGMHWLIPLFGFEIVARLPQLTASAGILAAIVGLLVNGVIIGAVRAVVIEKRSFIQSWHRGAELLFSEWRDFLALGVILLLLSLAFSYGIQHLEHLVQSVGLILGISHMNFFSVELNLESLTANPASLAALFFLFIVVAFLAVFSAAVWTLAFRIWQMKQGQLLSNSITNH